ncbi:MAG: ribosome maturation factor RimM [Gemmiger sp.]
MHDYLPACKVVTTHGVRGEMKAQLLCDDAHFLGQFRRLFTDAHGGGETALKGARPQGNMVLIKLEGIDDMDAARRMAGRTLYFAHDDVKLPKGRYLIDDLLGFAVIDACDGTVYGTLTAVTHPGAQDIYTVTAPDGREYMMPAVDAFVRQIDPEGGRVLVTPIPGLFGEAVNGDE